MDNQDKSVRLAAEWIAAQPPGVTVPAVKAQFHLSAREACEAMAAAAKLRRSIEEVAE